MKETVIAAAKLSEINNGEMKEVVVGETKVLLVRTADKCFAIGANCTHYGAPLVEGALVEDRIICPWHHACFDAATGDLREPPALDSLPNYPVRIDGDEIFVSLPGEPTDRRTPEMTKGDLETDKRVFVILGGGAAGYMAAQTLREDGYAGRIVMITRENRFPYDRPNLSKDYLAGHAEPEWMPLRSEEFFEIYNIEILFEREVAKVEAAAKKITFADGEVLLCDKLLVATGGNPRKLDLPNAGLKNIFLLRSFENADDIIAAVDGSKSAAIIGASFIGMETAASLKQRGIAVTIIAPDQVPFERVLGTEIGKLFRQVHEENGVEFRLGSQVKGFVGDETVQAVVLDSGENVEADLVIVGIGVSPATAFLEGVALHKDGGVIADRHLQIGEDLYAAGDIVHFPDARTGESIRIEHWRTALQQGRTAAHNMAGKATSFEAIPFFWTTQFGVTLNYVGHIKSWDEIIVQGDVEKKDFLAFYVKDYKVLAVAGMNRDTELAYMQELIRLNRIPSPKQLREKPSDALQMYATVGQARL
jgi:Uncharacterized NAD(FAD)-dependent dehydrogenases